MQTGYTTEDQGVAARYTAKKTHGVCIAPEAAGNVPRLRKVPE